MQLEKCILQSHGSISTLGDEFGNSRQRFRVMDTHPQYSGLFGWTWLHGGPCQVHARFLGTHVDVSRSRLGRGISVPGTLVTSRMLARGQGQQHLRPANDDVNQCFNQ
jgi:hypothetical protein